MFYLRGKFNSILEERLHDGKPGAHRIMSIKVDTSGYDNLGNLSSDGKTHFWKEVDRALKRFDSGEIKLKPRKSQPPIAKSAAAQETNTPCRQLPIPPLQHRRSRESPHRQRSHSRSLNDGMEAEIIGHIPPTALIIEKIAIETIDVIVTITETGSSTISMQLLQFVFRIISNVIPLLTFHQFECILRFLCVFNFLFIAM